ncbi:MAG TPA: DUF1801 domain-containing protein [Flavobacteriaceae bacterium]|nr:DUF1801 domain-containing protein [Flavobacteriaceae bacterium]
MASSIKTPEEYISNLPEERKKAFLKLRKTLVENLPVGFAEEISYGMIGFVVPKSLYPEGYHCNPELPLPFISLASQKNFIALYHMGIYANQKLLDWFVNEYPKHSDNKLDMGKSCIRFKNPNKIPFELIGELASKMTPQDWIAIYEQNVKR